MKKIYSSKIIFLLSAAYTSNVLADITLKMDQDLIIGNVPVIPVMALDGDTQYQIGNSQLNMQTEHAVICNRIDGYSPVSNVNVRVTDPNGDNKGDGQIDTSLMGVQSNVSYSVRRRAFDIMTENRSKSICLTSPEFDVIYADRFGDDPEPVISDITYELIGAPVGGYEPGDDLEYQLTYVNNSSVTELVDVIEYFPYTNNSPAYFNGLSVSLFTCELLDGNDTNVGSCSSANGVINDINLMPNFKVRLSVRRPISMGSEVGANIEMMAAVFPKVNTIDSIGTNQSFAGFDLRTLIIPIAKSN